MFTHIMQDYYRGVPDKLRSLEKAYELLDEIRALSKKDFVTPPLVIPYFRPKVPSDTGISLVGLFPDGHFTIHTFDQKSFLFLDYLDMKHEIVKNDSFEKQLTASVFKVYGDSSVDTFFRKKSDDPPEALKPNGFGPHLMIELDAKNSPTLNDLYQFLNTIPSLIGMTPITTPMLFQSADDITGIILIAESHIALHKRNGLWCIDLFSCKSFDVTQFITHIEKFFDVKKIFFKNIITRGLNFEKSS